MRKQVDTVLFCQACSKKFVLDDSVVEVKLHDISGGVPYVDRDDGKVKMPPLQARRRMFKCPGCGRGVVGKLLTKPSKDPVIISDRKSNTSDSMDPRT